MPNKISMAEIHLKMYDVYELNIMNDAKVRQWFFFL